MNVLVINSGSSSLKYKLFDMRDHNVLAAGVVEQIGEAQSHLTHHFSFANGMHQEQVADQHVVDHRHALQIIFKQLRESRVLPDPKHLYAIGHRVVHGGHHFHAPVLVTDRVLQTIRDMIPLAPLHNPANLTGIEIAQEFAPQVPHIAVFDTAFHQSIAQHVHLYALPYEFYENLHLRRYGFHGISHQYVSGETARHLKSASQDLNLISLHLGNGASVTAVQKGKSIDTSMGMTPLEGLIMGTRCGDIDPSIPFYLEKWREMDRDTLEYMLNHESGLKGICGISDMREIEQQAEKGKPRARLAIEAFCYRIRKYIGAYSAILGKVDALVFTGGIGENSALIRARCCQDLAHLGIILDHDKNRLPVEHITEIQKCESNARILVIRSNEELEIARQSIKTLSPN